MKTGINDKHYLMLIDYILNNKKFNKIADFHHHGTTRLEHSLRVSYISYKIAKLLGLDYKMTAVSGLLHDFFENSKDQSVWASIRNQVLHPKIAADNAETYFNISEKERNIIETHMFPLTFKPSRYLEGWVVSLVDTAIGAYEHSVRFKYQFTLWTLFVFNILR